MADEKKSSIYDDGSSSELDEYGVWVTSESTDVSSDKLAGDNLPDLEAELGSLEAQPLDEVAGDDLEMSFDMLDLPDGEEEPQEELNVEDILAENDDFTGDEILLDESSEEFGKIEETSVSDAKEFLPIDADASTEKPEQLDTLTESAGHMDVKEIPVESSSSTTEIFMENLLDDSPFDDDDEEEISATQEEKEKLDGSTLIEMPALVQETVVATETPDEAVPEDKNDSIDEMLFDVDAALAEAGIPVDIEMEKEPTPEVETLVEQVEEAPIEAEISVEQTAIPVAETKSLTQKAPESQKTEIAPNLSTELLLRIAEELSSIRQELSSLKQNFFEHRDKEVQSETVLVEEESAPALGGGFFDDSGDEKIALTGDELDGILMSADFTEESGAGVIDDFETVADEEILEQEVSTEVEEGRAVDTEKDSEELQELEVEDAVAPITPAEEVPQDEEALGVNLDLSDTVIDEPDLQMVENSVQEPVLEGISFDDSILDMGDEAVEEPQEEEELIEEPEAEIPLPEEEPTLEIPEPVTGSAVYEKPVPSIEETPPAELIPEPEDTAKTSPIEAPVEIPPNIKDELKTVLSYMDQLLESLPEEKIEEFASSKYFDTYKKLFAELGIV